MLPTNYLTGVQTIALVRSGEVTVSQVIQDHKIRYDERGDVLKAWVTAQHDKLLEDGTKSEDKPLTGMTVGVKDIIDTKDMPTAHGCEALRGSQPGVDAAVVKVLRAAGALIIGKTTTHEFATGAKPPTLNPFDPNLNAGGSSVGSAVAVCDYQCHVALGSQTSGSLIRPSADNGVFGFKPTWGAVCLDGVGSLSPMFDTLGFQARSIRDIEQVCRQFDIVKSGAEIVFPLSGAKIGFAVTDLAEATGTEDLRAAWGLAQDLLAAAGATVSDVDLGDGFTGLTGKDCTAWKVDKISEGSRQAVEERLGEPVVPADITRSRDEIAACRPKMDALLSQYDVLVTPSQPGEPVMIGQPNDYAFVFLWTAMHVPMINIPGLAGSHGLPVGLSLVAPRGGDEKLLQIAKSVADVFIKAGKDKMVKIPAPEGAVHLQP